MVNMVEENVHAVIRKARDAFDEGIWASMNLSERGINLKKTAQLIRKHAKQLAQIESRDTGKTIKHTTFIDVPTAADTFEYFGGLTNVLDKRKNRVEQPVKSTVYYEPYGVVASIIPWNYPLIFAAWKAAPALIAGNCVILKASPVAHASVLKLAEIIGEAGFPEGVFNILAQTDTQAAIELVKSKDVDFVSFTGSNKAGREVMKEAAAGTKKITLELGGKSPNIVFADCNMEAALGGTLSAGFLNQGQMCTAGSRILIEESVYDEFLAKLVEKARALKIGDPLDYETQFGPLVNAEHRDKVLAYIHEALKEGAKIACGGKIPEGFSEGAYIEPTILTHVNNSMNCTQTEVFGPVVTVQKFGNEKEAVKLANDCAYGLAASVWTRDDAKAERVSQQLKCGTVWINTYGMFLNEAPFGGYKQSGFGRELGIEGVLEYTQAKHVCKDQTPGGVPLVSGWF